MLQLVNEVSSSLVHTRPPYQSSTVRSGVNIMAFSDLGKYIKLPFSVARSFVLNGFMTIAGNVFKKQWHRKYLSIVEIQEGNKYMEGVSQNQTQVSYFWQRLKTFWHCNLQEVRIQAELNKAAPNPMVVPLEDLTKEYRLLDLAKVGRPLVINFGACT
ncbi:uncharacterized protein [Panulirus ornatus]|uniref:uncharacterized protein isoform X1 n=1 Tax=Panulirus ornatus TaxID=150431 RepID=UPI003A8B1C1A